jgi:hypothetical protein
MLRFLRLHPSSGRCLAPVGLAPFARGSIGRVKRWPEPPLLLFRAPNKD